MTEVTAAQLNITEQAAEIVGAYVAHNSVPATELPNLLRSVYNALASLGNPAPVGVPAEPLKPAVSVRKSITDEYLISLENGRKFKSLKRYLAGLGMTPADYRAKWSLPSDYPMVAPAYAAKRSELARSTGLGRKAVPTAADTMAALTEPAPTMTIKTEAPTNDAGKKPRRRVAKAA